MEKLLFGLTLVLADAEWAGVWRGWERARWVTKPGTLLALIAWFTLVGRWQGPLAWFGAGLVFSLLGDVLLMLEAKYFTAGLAAFLTGHLLYIIGFSQGEIALTWAALLPAAAVGIFLLVYNRVLSRSLARNHLQGMAAPVALYSLVISVMWLMALSTLLRPQWSGAPSTLAAVGATLFVTSDSVLAFNKFVRPLPLGDLAVMVTYHLGQICLAGGALLAFA